MFSETEGWEAAFENLAKNVVPTLARVSAEEERLYPKTPNLVTTVALLPPDYTLPLHSIARRFPCAQFAPNIFAAIRITLRDNASQTTALLFSTGAMVVVGSRSRQHALYWSRVVAVMISSTRFPIYNKKTNQIEMHVLADYMCFDNFKTHNFVGHGYLGHTVDLHAIYNTYPCCTDRFDGLFPGLTCHVWLTKDYACRCTAKNKKSCKCSLRVLLFDTGKVVLPGCQSIEIMNAVFYRVRKAVDTFVPTREIEKPAEVIYEQTKRAKRSDSYRLMPYKPQSMGTFRKSALPAIVRFAMDDRLEEVAHLLSIHPQCIQNTDVQKRMLLVEPPDRMPNYETILKLLKDAEGA